MEKYKNPGSLNIDIQKYETPDSELQTYYGLPHDVKFCNKCVVSNQRPNSTVEYLHHRNSIKETINIQADDTCDACKVNVKKKKIDWEEREKELIELCNRYRRTDGHYDCLVPGSGGKDSFYAAHHLKYKYNMHPLTITWAPHLYTTWGWHNFQSWIGAGFDNYLFTPNKKTHRLLTRLAVENLLHPFQPFIIGQKSFAPKVATILKIPLIFYGENEAEYGNPEKDFSAAQRDWKYCAVEEQSKIYIGGTSIEDLKSHFGMDDNDLNPYLPANPEKLEENKTEIHYLGYYLKWHPQGAYYYAVENGDFQVSRERTPGTYSKYNSLDDKIDDLHYYTTHIKFGIGRATYDASQEIRNGEIDRDEGVALVKRFDGEYPERFEKELFQYLSINPDEFPIASKMFEEPIMNKDYFLDLCNHFRSPHLWKYANGEWKLRYTVWNNS